MPRTIGLRLGLRGAMVAVAIVAMALGLVNLQRRREDFRKAAVEHERLHRMYSGYWKTVDGRPWDNGYNSGLWMTYGDQAKLHAYYGDLVKKYEYASEHPWLPIEPDPPVPKVPPN